VKCTVVDAGLGRIEMRDRFGFPSKSLWWSFLDLFCVNSCYTFNIVLDANLATLISDSEDQQSDQQIADGLSAMLVGLLRRLC
jgi:hypothetical protein